MYFYDPERIAYFATTDYRGKRTPFGIKAKDRMRHMYVIGKTGMGKSTLLENLSIQDIRSGEGICFIDPHGSTASKLLDYIPKERINDVVYFAPFDMEYPIGFNIMEDIGYERRHLVVAGLMSAFRRIWVDAWSSRMEYILQNTLLALLEYPNSTLIDVNRMYVDKEFRKSVVDNIKDPIVKSYWKDEFTKYTDRYTQEATPAIQNKIGQFTGNPLIRNIIGQPKSTIDIRKIMDERKILIVNLSKGRIGEQNADLLGSILTTKIYLEAMGRAELSEEEQRELPPFYLFVDEFQSVVNDSFANILSEARKYKLSLTLAHQYIEQIDENIRAAVFGNAGTIITFRVGPFDAEVLKTIFEPIFSVEDIVNLGFAQIYLSLMIDGVATKPFSARTLPPFDKPDISYKNEIIKHSQKTYGVPRSDVEELIKMHAKSKDRMKINLDNKEENKLDDKSENKSDNNSKDKPENKPDNKSKSDKQNYVDEGVLQDTKKSKLYSEHKKEKNNHGFNKANDKIKTKSIVQNIFSNPDVKKTKKPADTSELKELLVSLTENDADIKLQKTAKAHYVLNKKKNKKENSANNMSLRNFLQYINSKEDSIDKAVKNDKTKKDNKEKTTKKQKYKKTEEISDIILRQILKDD